LDIDNLYINFKLYYKHLHNILVNKIRIINKSENYSLKFKGVIKNIRANDLVRKNGSNFLVLSTKKKLTIVGAPPTKITAIVKIPILHPPVDLFLIVIINIIVPNIIKIPTSISP